MDNEQREKLHQTAALQCLLCGETKAERVAQQIPQLVDHLRAVTAELNEYQRSAKVPDDAPPRRRCLDALALLDHIDTGRPL